MNRPAVIILLFLLALVTTVDGANSSTNFGGVGIDGVPLEDGRIVIRQLVAGGPADLAGLRNGDIITRVDGKPTRGSDFHTMVEYRLRGKAGTKVLLSVERPGVAKPLSVTLTRRQLLAPAKETMK